MRKGLLSLVLLICLCYGKLFTFHNCTCRAERGVPSGRRGEAPCIHMVPVGYVLMAPVEGEQSRICSMLLFPRIGSAPEKSRLTEPISTSSLTASICKLSPFTHFTPCFLQDPCIDLLSGQCVILNATRKAQNKVIFLITNFNFSSECHHFFLLFFFNSGEYWSVSLPLINFYSTHVR